MSYEVPAERADLPTEKILAASTGTTKIQAVAQGASLLTSIYVSTTGNDQWSGGLSAANASGTDGPVKTLARAQQIARAQIVAMGSSRVPLNVLIAAGQYQLSDTLAFDISDSGTAAAPVTYSAIVPGTVTISGGVQLTQRSLASASTPAVFDNAPTAGTNWKGGSQLYVNDVRATLARTPNAGSYWFVTKPVPVAGEPAATQGSQAFGVDPNVQTWINGLSAADKDRAIITVMHSWTASHHRFANISVPVNTVAVSPQSAWPFLKFGGSQRYFVENVPSALDAAGEFLWDSSGVRYMAKSGQTGVALQATMPVLERLMTIRGSMGNMKWAEYLQFRGLTFAHSRALTADGGENDSQAAVYVSAAIEVDSANHIVFDNCTIKHTGGYALWFRSAVVDSSITNSVLTDLGAGGIKIGAPGQAATDPVITGRNTVSGNSISESGKTYPGAVGVLVGQSFDNVVSNNAIFNTTYSGISVGWTWGYGATQSGRNMVTDNLLFNIGSGQLSDIGAIYTLGISPGTVVSGNVIRQVRGYTGYGPGAWGMFSDEGTSNVLYQNNLVVGTDSGGYHLNFGRDNVLQSNLLSFGDKAEIQVSVTDPTRTKLGVTSNTLVPLANSPFFKFAQSPDAVFTANTVSSAVATGTLELSKCGAGCATSNFDIVETTAPRGITVTGNATLASKYAAIVAKAGPTSVPVNGTVAVNVRPVVQVAPVLAFDFPTNSATIGTQPMGLQYSPAGDLTAAAITADATAPGGRCLQLNENPSRPNAYDPYVVALLKHEQGSTVGEFSLKIDTNTNFVHEWRDNNSPYKVGPSITVTRSGVWVNGKVVAPVTVGQWTTIKINAPLAGTGTTWSMDVRNASGTTTTVTNLPFGTAGWGKLHWFGFVSYAKVTSSLCLANIKATTTTQ